MERRRVLSAVTVAVMLTVGTAAAAATLSGKVVYRDAPIEGAVVSVYAGNTDGFSGAPAHASAPTGKDGSFSVALPAGRYFLIVRRPASGPTPGLYAYYGGNPVTIGDADAMDVGVNCGPVIAVPQRSMPGGTGIRGTVYADEKPLPSARVTVYQDGDSIYRGMGYASTMTNARGEFAFNLEPGTYYVIARKRAGDSTFGPMAAGDLFSYAPDNPVTVVPEVFSVIALSATAKVAKGKDGSVELTISGTVRAGETVIEGTVKDPSGKPVAGLYVAAYKDSMMISRPDFISKRTGPDGKYAISVSDGGEYYVGARNTLGGPAEKGDLLGRYGGNEEHKVVLRKGERLTGIDIAVEGVE